MDVVHGLDDGVHVGHDLVCGTLVEVEVDPAAQDTDDDTHNNKEEHLQSPLTHSNRVTLFATYCILRLYSPDACEGGGIVETWHQLREEIHCHWRRGDWLSFAMLCQNRVIKKILTT